MNGRLSKTCNAAAVWVCLIVNLRVLTTGKGGVLVDIPRVEVTHNIQRQLGESAVWEGLWCGKDDAAAYGCAKLRWSEKGTGRQIPATGPVKNQ